MRKTMGRKRKAEKSSVDTVEDKTSNACSETTIEEEKIFSPANNNLNAKEAMDMKNTDSPDSASLPPKKKDTNSTNVVVRRSDRLKSSLLRNWRRNGSRKVAAVVDQVNLVENEKEEAPKPVNSKNSLEEKDSEEEAPQGKKVTISPVISEENLEEEAPQGEKVGNLPVVSEISLEEEEPQTQILQHVSGNEKNLEEKVDYIFRVVDEYKSKSSEQVVTRQNVGPSTDLSYKSLYFDSQKKMEELAEQHYALVKELEYAKGKIEAYEKMNAVNASKGVIYVSTLGNTTEAAVSLSPQTVQKCASPTAADIEKASSKRKNHVTPNPKKNNYKKKKTVS